MDESNPIKISMVNKLDR